MNWLEGQVTSNTWNHNSSNLKLLSWRRDSRDIESSDWRGDWCDSPAMPKILTVLEDWGKQRAWAKRSDTNEVDEAESRRPRAFTWDPSGACMRSWHVIKRALDANTVAALLETGSTAEASEGCSHWELPLSLWMSVVRFLALSALIIAATLSGEVTGLETVYTQLVLLNYWHHLVTR